MLPKKASKSDRRILGTADNKEPYKKNIFLDARGNISGFFLAFFFFWVTLTQLLELLRLYGESKDWNAQTRRLF